MSQKERFHYVKEQSLDGWIETIETKFSDLPLLNNLGKTIGKILAIEDEYEISKIDRAGLTIFGNRTGILTFEDACNKLNIIKDKEILLSNDTINICRYKLKIIADALNDGWIPDYYNIEEKWTPYFTGKDLVFFGAINSFNFTYEDIVNLRIIPLKNKELTEYCGKQFIELYRDIINNINSKVNPQI